MRWSKPAYKIFANKRFDIKRYTFSDLFGRKKPIIGALHLLPLPGAPLYKGNLAEVIEIAIKEAKIYEKFGLSAICIENFRDFPFFPHYVPPETIAAMTAVGREVKKVVSLPLGVNALRSDAQAALAVATAIGASFIRVNVHMGAVVSEQGVIYGKSHNTLRYRNALQANTLIFADIGVKHAAPLADRGLATEAKDAEQRGLADAIIISGPMTGQETSLEDLKITRSHTKLPILIGSGTTPDNVNELLKNSDGAFVGSYFKYEGMAQNLVDPKRVKKFMDAYYQQFKKIL